MPKRILVALRFARAHESWWAETLSGFAAAGIAVSSWAASDPLEHHAVLGHIARIVGGPQIIAIGLALGVLQVAAVVADRPPWRWVVAIAMAGWWSIPVLQTFKAGISAPMVTGGCSAWAVANLVAVWCLLRPVPTPVPGAGRPG